MYNAFLDAPRTVAAALRWATDALTTTSATPRLDAGLLLAHALGWSRARVLAEREQLLHEAQQTLFAALVERRATLEPVAYIVGHKAFYGLVFEVSPAVLVPRPETELLVELALQAAARYAETPLLIADIGTGSGAIAVALAVQLPRATLYAVDISPDALQVAARNIVRHGVSERVRLLEGDLLEPVPEQVHLLVSNPPYTVLAEIDENVRRHEPHLALDGGPDGLEPYRRLLAQAPAKLRRGGTVLLEVGATQGQPVMDIARAHFPAAQIHVHADFAGHDRVVVIEERGTAERRNERRERNDGTAK